jgi:hypothetical protein
MAGWQPTGEPTPNDEEQQTTGNKQGDDPIHPNDEGRWEWGGEGDGNNEGTGMTPPMQAPPVDENDDEQPSTCPQPSEQLLVGWIAGVGSQQRGTTDVRAGWWGQGTTAEKGPGDVDDVSWAVGMFFSLSFHFIITD